MSQELQTTKAEQIAEEALDFFDRVSRQMVTPTQLAIQTGYSLKTVYNRINQGQSIVEEHLRKNAPKYLANVWKRYEYIWDQARVGWENTSNPKFLAEMRACLDAMRKMLSVDEAPKAAVGADGKAIPGALIMIFDDKAYREKEAEQQKAEKNAIEGEFTVSSTEVPLTTAPNDVKIPENGD